MRIITRHEHFMPANKFSGIYVLQDFVSPIFAGFRFSNVSCQADIRNPLRCLIRLNLNFHPFSLFESDRCKDKP